MTNPTSMIDVFNMFLEHSRDPFLNSMQGSKMPRSIAKMGALVLLSI